MNWDGYGIYQRTDSDCGIAAIATLVGLPYDAVEKAWRSALNRKPGASSYKDLLATLAALEILAEKAVNPSCGIRRCRGEKYARHSHWIVTYSDGSLWCPTIGYVPGIADYGMPHLGHGIRLV
jgi:hypothetical protein